MRTISDRFLLAGLSTIFAVSACTPPEAEIEPGRAVGVFVESQPVVREILGQVDNPPGAPERRLSLVRYTIAPGAELAPHVHPGVQMASMVSGVLSYRVVSGTVAIQRAVGVDGRPGTIELLTGPTDTELRPGDTVVEDGMMLHFGANRTAEPVVILAALITEDGAELAIPITSNEPVPGGG